jgi:hypothetical protein
MSGKCNSGRDNTLAGVGLSETQGPCGMRQIQIMVDNALPQTISKNGPGALALQSRYELRRTSGRG